MYDPMMHKLDSLKELTNLVTDSHFIKENHMQVLRKKSEKMNLGALRSVLFTSKDKEPFSYLVGVLQRDKRLVVVEVFFPNREALDERFSEIRRALEEFNVR